MHPKTKTKNPQTKIHCVLGLACAHLLDMTNGRSSAGTTGHLPKKAITAQHLKQLKPFVMNWCHSCTLCVCVCVCVCVCMCVWRRSGLVVGAPDLES